MWEQHDTIRNKKRLMEYTLSQCIGDISDAAAKPELRVSGLECVFKKCQNRLQNGCLRRGSTVWQHPRRRHGASFAATATQACNEPSTCAFLNQSINQAVTKVFVSSTLPCSISHAHFSMHHIPSPDDDLQYTATHQPQPQLQPEASPCPVAPS